MRFLLLLTIALTILYTTCQAAPLTYNSATYADISSKAKSSIRRLADILDMEMMSRRLSSPDNSYYHVYPQRMSSVPLTIYPLPAKRLHRIGGNIVMGK